ncbi:hypothetical protein H0A36_22355 [Endozoicomonas sp. SM1973]|uniref:Uncharacterized protein n=1 Tax=Spartinivicinus marinus TaxID=2994442 RepID=A0A853I602_9GAMM|nr:hypothetical protein [Spartinivicinus marinus]MCX4029087.1 hypothetical protein [Spartinivicinus marinus]NYZ68763.1 hypothetical protein [Spartinivicinus marinus]
MSGVQGITGSGCVQQTQPTCCPQDNSQGKGDKGISQDDIMKLIQMLIQLLMQSMQNNDKNSESNPEDNSQCGSKGPEQSSASPIKSAESSARS